MRIGIVGPGRLGRSLAALLAPRGCEVDLRARGQGWPERVEGVLLTVPDGAVAAAAASWRGEVPLLHCSGSLPVEVLRPARPAGSLHPLMTFPGPEVALPDPTTVPLALDGDPEAIALGERLADALGARSFRVPGDRRLYHAAAVMAGNFATVLLAEAARVLSAAGVPPGDARALLAPLALQSLRNAVADPARALTGPVARGDLAVLDAHRAAMRQAGLATSIAVYDALTERALALATGAAPPVPFCASESPATGSEHVSDPDLQAPGPPIRPAG